MMLFSWQLTLLVLFLAVSQTLIMAKASKKITENTDILQKIVSNQNQVFFDIIKSLSFIKMISASQLIEKRYKKINEDSAQRMVNISKVNIALQSFNTLFEAVNILAIFGLGIILYFLNRIDLGSVVSFLILQDGITYMISNLSDFFKGISSQIVNLNRVLELTNQEIEEGLNISESRSIQNDDIFIRDLSFTYHSGTEYTLKNVSFTIPKGQITAIYGASGGGKSTLIKLLLALYPIMSGSISIGEIDYKNIGIKKIRENFAYVEQSIYLFYDTVEANIQCDNQTATLEDVIEAAKLAKAHEFIIQKPEGYNTMIYEHGKNFSGGEKQRIAIARAILKKANVFILDEATNAIDTTNESYIYDHIQKLAMEGKTILIIAHRENALQLADNVIHIENGMIVNSNMS